MTIDESNSTRSPARAGRAWRAVALFVTTAALLLGLDLATKHLAFQHVPPTPATLERDAEGRLAPIAPHAARSVIPRVLALHLTVNEGAVFGLGQGGRWIFVVFSVVASLAIAIIFARSAPASWVLHMALAAVLAGAIGNLYDRLRFGVVRDMLYLFPDVKLPFGLSWPDGSTGLYPWIFNVADVCLIIGLVVLMILSYRTDKTRARQQARERARFSEVPGTP